VVSIRVVALSAVTGHIARFTQSRYPDNHRVRSPKYGVFGSAEMCGFRFPNPVVDEPRIVRPARVRWSTNPSCTMALTPMFFPNSRMVP